MSSSTSYAVKRRFAGPELSPAALAERWQHCKKESPYVEGKHRLLPHMLRVITANIESFDYFVTTEIKKVVGAAPNKVIRSEVDPNWFLEYKDVYVGSPTIDEDSFTQSKATPFECRVRDETYSAPIYVDVEYRVGGATTAQKKVLLGKIPIMLRSSKCVLSGQSAAAVSKKNECEYDPGGYFIVKGVEKVILMQEQLSKNRVIVESDAKGHVAATITSSTHERKSRCSIVVKPYAHGKRVYLRHNTLGEDIPVVIVLKAMGLVSDQEIAELVAGGGGASNSSSSKKKKKSDLGGARGANSSSEEGEKKKLKLGRRRRRKKVLGDVVVVVVVEPRGGSVRHVPRGARRRPRPDADPGPPLRRERDPREAEGPGAEPGRRRELPRGPEARASGRRGEGSPGERRLEPRPREGLRLHREARLHRLRDAARLGGGAEP